MDSYSVIERGSSALLSECVKFTVQLLCTCVWRGWLVGMNEHVSVVQLHYNKFRDKINYLIGFSFLFSYRYLNS